MQIGTWLTDAIEEPFSSAFVKATYVPGSTVYQAGYVRLDGPAAGVPFSDDAQRCVDILRAIFRREQKPLWGQFRLDVDPGGTFKIDFAYDHCDSHS